jgi:hypothetical protein
MNRKRQIKEINLVLDYSNKVYGSCTHSYMGCMADAGLLKIVGGGDYGGLDRKTYSVLFEEATDEQMDEAHEYVSHWIPIAKKYMAPGARVGRAIAQFT